MEELADAIAIKEHLARKVGVHPRDVEVDGEEARCRKVPLSAFPFGIDRQGGVVSVSDDGPERLDLGLVQDYWRGRLGIADSPREQLLLAAVRRFLGRLTVIDPAALEKIRDFGFWRRAEREDYRARAAALGVPTVIHFLDVPEAVLVARLEARNQQQADDHALIPIAMLKAWLGKFEPPDANELGLVDRP